MLNEGFICPLCKNPLQNKDNSLLCKKGHSFDLAREGYAYLLPVQKKRTKIPGDSKEMVDARVRFLEEGYYSIFADTLSEICLKEAKRAKKPVHILDMGCGQGYYSNAVAKTLLDNHIDFELIGFDIAKSAVKYASKHGLDNCSYAVASCFDCPVESSWADIAINIFSPFAEKETLRLLKKGGKFIYAVPGKKHLFGLKEVLYETPYENKVQDIKYEGLKPLETVVSHGDIVVKDGYIQDLFSMTPYYWKTPKEGSQKLSLLKELKTPIEFRFLQFYKK